jgi:hypothetical protein
MIEEQFRVLAEGVALAIEALVVVLLAFGAMRDADKGSGATGFRPC